MKELIPTLKEIAIEAGEAILEIYNNDAGIEVSTKTDDSPVTKADIAAHHIIEDGLKALNTGFPILSEEGGIPDYIERKEWEKYWLIDPLDGTKEFINKNGEFTVNIALIENDQAVLGIVYVPVTGVIYVGCKENGAWKESNGNKQELTPSPLELGKKLVVVGSRRHGAEALERLLERLEEQFEEIELVSMGSSLKICALAEGSAHWYPRLALTCEWDTAAAHAVLDAAGGQILTDKLQTLRYNSKEELLNPFFHATCDRSQEWPSLINS